MIASRGSSVALLLDGSLLDDSPDVVLGDSEEPLPFPHAASERATTAAIHSATCRPSRDPTLLSPRFGFASSEAPNCPPPCPNKVLVLPTNGAQGVLERDLVALPALCR